MIKALKIKNFQSHRKTVLELSPGVNVLVGLSNAGKTSILRALGLLKDNRPLGARYFSDFAGKEGDTEIECVLDDGTEISLKKHVIINEDGDKEIRAPKGEKSETKAIYKIGDKEFKGFDKAVPDVIERALNFSELNIQKQLEQPYLITSSPGEIARTTNRVTKLEEVDQYGKELTQRINMSGSKVKLLEQELIEDQKGLEKYDNLEEVAEIIIVLEQVDQEASSKQREIEELEVFVEALDKITKEEEVLRRLLRSERYVNKLEKVYKDLELILSERDLIEQVLEIDRVIEDMDSLEIRLLPVCIVMEKQILVIKKVEQLTMLVELEKEIDEFTFSEKVASKEYEDMLTDFGRCPLCYSEVNDTMLDNVRRLM